MTEKQPLALYWNPQARNNAKEANRKVNLERRKIECDQKKLESGMPVNIREGGKLLKREIKEITDDYYVVLVGRTNGLPPTRIFPVKKE
jgi:hypothetical protein